MRVSERSERALGEKVFDGESYRPFGEYTAADATGRADELKEMTGFGPTMRVRLVAQGWRELARSLEQSGAATVAALPAEQIEEYAEKCWVIQPEKGLMSDPPPDPPPA